jgi:DNA polymerase III epsilon subunit family exonuclease
VEHGPAARDDHRESALNLPDFDPADVRFVAFDTETTGSFPLSERIVEIGAIRFAADGTVLGEFCELVDPGIPIPSNVVRVHGIRNKDVAGKDPIERVLPRFIDFIGDAVLIAHNAAFDVTFLGVQMILHRIALPENPILDSITMCKRFFPAMKRNNLRSVSEFLGMTDVRCHRALADSRIVRELFLVMAQGPDGTVDLDALFQHFDPIRFECARRVFDAQVPRHLRRLRADVERSRPIRIEYDSRADGRELLTITPRDLFQHNRNAYLLAYCPEEKRLRNFRLDRIRQILSS